MFSITLLKKKTFSQFAVQYSFMNIYSIFINTYISHVIKYLFKYIYE